jgi:hypothetical protein
LSPLRRHQMLITRSVLAKLKQMKRNFKDVKGYATLDKRIGLDGHIIIIIITTTFCGSWPALKTVSSHPILVPLFSS